MKPHSLSLRLISSVLIFSFATTFLLQGKAYASHLGSSTASAGTAAPPALTAVESFQPDLFTGRATLSIPIAVPPGRRGLQPSLSLGYSSSGANGVCGVGWSIELAHIGRSTKLGVPQYASTDTFQLSFQGVTSELVSIGGGEFRAKDEQLFLKIQFNGSDEWTVWDKAGTKYLFRRGQADASGRIFTWELQEVRDRLGNTMTSEYIEESGARYLSVIHYTGNANTSDPPTNRVEFIYEARSDPIVTLRSGSKVTIAKRLKEIKTYAQDALARIYRLDYTQSARTSRSLLESVTQIGSDGETSLPATRFTYQSDTGPVYHICSNTAFEGRSAWNVRKANIDTGHCNNLPCHPYLNVPWGAPVIVEGTRDLGCMNVTVNPDASIRISGCKDHFVHAYTWVYVASARTITFNRWGSWDVACLWVEDSSGLRSYGNNPVSVNLNAGWSIIHLSGYHQHDGFSLGFSNSLKAQVDLINPTPFLEPALTGDFNGDGISDLATLEPSNGIWKVATSQACLVRPTTTWVSGFGSTNSIPLLGDWDGDGRADIAIFESGSWRFARSTGTSFTPNAFPATSGSSGQPLVGDFNGDGFTDIGVYTGGSWYVALSTGNGFGSFQTWLSRSTEVPLTGDFNGDGLTDVSGYDKGSGATWVALSSGSEFRPPVNWLPASGSWSGWDPTTAELNGDGRSDLVAYSRSTGQVKFLLSTGESFNASVETLPVTFTLRTPDDQIQMGDFNGDGLSDPAVFNRITGNAELTLSSGETPDLLKEITNPLGGRTSIAYQVSSFLEPQFLPFVVSVVREVTVSDGLGWTASMNYLYKGGLYDAPTKEFRGFAETTVIDPEANKAITRFHQDEHKKGRPFEQESQDDHENLLTKTLSTWGCDESIPGVHFCFLTSQDAFTYDGDATFKQTRTQFEYDAYGNLTRTIGEGDLGVLGDERTAETTYTYNTLDWIVAKPAQTQLKDANGQVVSRRNFFYDGHSSLTDSPTNGLLTQEVQWLDPQAPLADQPITTFTYDVYGNLESVTDPLGRTTTNTYDTATHTFLETITNQIDHTVAQQHDPRFGLITQTTDPNGQTTQFQYDPLGRTTAVIGPLDTLTLPGVRYEYDLTQVPSRTIKRVRERAGAASVLTSYTFADGLGRTIQVRTPAEDPNKQVVTGVVQFNSRGQVERQWLPYLEVFSDRYQAPPPNLAQSSYTYGPLGRLTETTNPDDSIWTTQYQDWTLTRTDANGNTIVRESDAYGRLMQVDEYNDGAVYTTRYTYDSKGNLTEVRDHAGNKTQIQYDLLGRKTAMDDPDTGHWTYAYDLVGNLTAQTDAKGQTLTFIYDLLNRLTQKSGPGVSVTYRYGELGHGFGVGRLTSITDLTGSSSFTYDVLGRQIKEDRTIDGTTYTVERDYDLLGRLTGLTYPDGEEVTYTYNSQGLVESVTGMTPYIRSADYNVAGQLTQLTYGNGVTTDYTYDPQTLRIENIKTTGSVGAIQDLTYSFDPVGNLTQLRDWVNTATQTFSYDDLNRLLQASGAYGVHSYAYDSLGNLTSKAGATLQYGQPNGTQPHAATYCEIPGLEPMNLTYDASGNLTQKGPHRFSYDAENRLTEVVRTDPVTETVTYTLQPGWNLITVPFDVEDQLIAAVLEDLNFGTDYDQVATFDKTDDHWLSFVNDDRFNQFDAFQSGRAHEIYVTQSSGVTFDLTGESPARRPILGLELGWNLIPSPVLTDTPLTEALEGLAYGSDYDEVIRYDPSTGGWKAVSVCRPGEAYWLHSLVTKSWVVPFPVSEVTTQMVYDGDGGRVKLITPNATTTFLGELYEIIGSEATKHIFMGPMRVSSVTSDSIQLAKGSDSSHPSLRAKRSNLYASLYKFFKSVEEFFVGNAYAMPGVQTVFYHPDHLGSTNIVTNLAGRQVELAEYTPFGSFSRKEVAQSTSNQQPATSNYFTGQRFDDTTQLYYYHARYYDPEIGRFTQPDTIVQAPSDPQTLNRYTYAKNNPLVYTDPTGHLAWFIPIIIGAIIGAGVGAYSAAQAGGSIFAGALFGAVIGAAFGAAAFGAANGLQAAWAAGGISIAEGVGIGAAVGAIGGFGSGLIGGFAGGKGSLGDMGKGALLGAGLGGLSGGIFGGISPFMPDILAAAVSAGVSSEVGGGDLWEGMAFGAGMYLATFALMSAVANWKNGTTDDLRTRGGLEGDAAVAGELFRVQQARESGVMGEVPFRELERLFQKGTAIARLSAVGEALSFPNKNQGEAFMSRFMQKIIIRSLKTDISRAMRNQMFPRTPFIYRDGPVTIPNETAIESSL